MYDMRMLCYILYVPNTTCYLALQTDHVRTFVLKTQPYPTKYKLKIELLYVENVLNLLLSIQNDLKTRVYFNIGITQKVHHTLTFLVKYEQVFG